MDLYKLTDEHLERIIAFVEDAAENGLFVEDEVDDRIFVVFGQEARNLLEYETLINERNRRKRCN